MAQSPGDPSRLDRLIAEARKHNTERENTYRERALKLYPHVCGRCAREFSGVRLRELTVHHKDHNHDNNPLDGSNWELLCIYCHENEHARVADEAVRGRNAGDTLPAATYNPFADLQKKLDEKRKKVATARDTACFSPRRHGEHGDTRREAEDKGRVPVVT